MVALQDSTSGKVPLRNARHEVFAQLLATAMPRPSDMEAYQRVYGCTIQTAHKNATKLRANTGILARIAHLTAKTASGSVLTKLERREYLARVVRANVTTLDPATDGDLLQEVTEETTERGTKRKVKLPGKRECIMADAELAGDLRPGAGEVPKVRLQMIAQGCNAAIALDIS